MKKEAYTFGREPKYNSRVHSGREKEMSKTANGIMVIGIAAMAFFLAISISGIERNKADENADITSASPVYSVFAQSPEEYGIYVPYYRSTDSTAAVKEALLEIFGLGGAS